MIGLGNVYALRHPESRFGLVPDTVGAVFMALGSLFAWLGPSMVIANLFVSVVPPARRALDQEGALAAGHDLTSANLGLLKLSALLTPLGILTALVGAMVDW